VLKNRLNGAGDGPVRNLHAIVIHSGSPPWARSLSANSRFGRLSMTRIANAAAKSSPGDSS
jgi:hypothetical protein